LNGDYDVQVSLSIEVNDTGGLTPSVSYMNPIHGMGLFTFSGNGTLSESRDHNFTENLQFSVREIYNDWKLWQNAQLTGGDTLSLDPHDCPPADTNLSGTLGINDFVAMAALSENLDTQNPKGVFGGSIQFLVTKNVTSVGPTWTIVHFKGPGGIANLSEVNTDKVTLAFAPGTGLTPVVTSVRLPRKLSTPKLRRPVNPSAYSLLQQLLTSSINTQLTSIQNRLQCLPGQC
jgi:hypothetical protein